MNMAEVKFPEGMQTESYLRNGLVKTTAVRLDSFGEWVMIDAFSSHGKPATGYIQLPNDYETLAALEREFRALALAAREREELAQKTFPTFGQYRDAAAEQYGSDDLEVDADASVSEADEGAWVQAYVWVRRSDVGALPSPEQAQMLTMHGVCIRCGDTEDIDYTGSLDANKVGTRDAECGCGAIWTEVHTALKGDATEISEVTIKAFPGVKLPTESEEAA